jgi:Flp pilus assembly pilin Flp
MVEYILILALVVAGSVGLWVTFGDKLTNMLKDTNDGLTQAGQGLDKEKAKK